MITAAAVVELIHLATLYHDDVMDEATMRRGAPSANSRWDNSVAILTGDFLFAHASRLVADLGPDAVRIIAETFAELVTGQMRETRGPRPDEDPVEHYLTVIAEKTGSLIATAGRYGGMFSGCTPEQVESLHRFGLAIGTAFQISRRHHRHRLAVGQLGQDARARTCARASSPCRCSTRCRARARMRTGCGCCSPRPITDDDRGGRGPGAAAVEPGPWTGPGRCWPTTPRRPAAAPKLPDCPAAKALACP